MANEKSSGSDLLRLCSYCKHPIADSGDPVTAITITEAPESLGVPVTHGICSVCLEGQRKELEEYRRSRTGSKKA